MKKEYTEDQIIDLKNKLINSEAVLTSSLEWLETTSNVIEKDSIRKNIKNHRRQFRKLIPRVNEKPAIAFFGASQCGKSHLVKNLLKGEHSEMKVYDNVYNRDINFIKYINPDGGGNEATALVTRFKDFEKSCKIRYPVKLDFLSVKDIILTLVDGFSTLGPIENLELPSSNFVLGLNEKLLQKNSIEVLEILNEDDIFEIRDYLEKYKKKEIALLLEHLKKLDYWEVLSENISKLNVSQLSEYFSVLWYCNASLSNFFIQLIETLKYCNFSSNCYSNFDIILKQKPEEYDKDFSKITNILDVFCLNGFKTGINETVKIFDSSDNVIEIYPHLLCAICKEVTLLIKNEISCDSYLLDKLDILDFPGARPGTKFTTIDEIEINILMEILKRGKISYLFNVYSDNFQISNLAVVSCMSRQLDGASLIPNLLNSWIATYIGENSIDRSNYMNTLDNQVPPLFIVLTYLNEILIYNPDKDTVDPKDKLKTVFQTRLKEDLFADFAWRTNWSISNNNSSTFKNIYLLRDFSYCQLFNKINGKETTVKSEYESYFSNVRNSIIKSTDSNTIFNNVVECFDKASHPNLDGSQFIIANLSSLRTNYLKTNSIVQKCTKSLDMVTNELHVYKKSDNIADRIVEVKEHARRFNDKISRLVSDNLNVSYLINKFILKEIDVFHLVYSMITNKDFGRRQDLSKYYAFYLDYPKLKTLNTRIDKLEYLSEVLKKKSTDEVIIYLNTELDIDSELLLDSKLEKLDNLSLYMTKKVKNFWFDKHLNPENFESDKKYLDGEFVNSLTFTLITNFEKLNISDLIAEKIRPYVEYHDAYLDDVVHMISNIITGIINKYISDFGWEFTSNDEKARLIKLCNENNMLISDNLHSKSVNLFNSEKVEAVYNYLREYESKIVSSNTEERILLNPYISAFVRYKNLFNLSIMANVEATNYDIQSNQELIKILDRFNDVKISID